MTTILSVSSISLLDQIGLWFIVIGRFVIFVCVMIWMDDCAKQADKEYGGGRHPVWSRYEPDNGLAALIRFLLSGDEPEPEPKPLTKRQQRQRERMIRKRRERVRKYRERQALEQERLKNQESES